jgi:hypothetical protein
MSQADSKTPFFARYLEGQTYPQVKSDLKAGFGPGFPVVTLKYPSDNEDGRPGYVTLKAPSDSEG